MHNVHVNAYIVYVCIFRCIFVYTQIDIVMYVCKIRFEVLPGVGMYINTYV